MSIIIVGASWQNTEHNEKNFKCTCFFHDGFRWWERWSYEMLQKTQNLCPFPCYLSNIRQHGVLRSILQRSEQKSPNVFIWLGNTDIHPTDLCNQVQTELPHWKTQVKKCSNEIAVNKAVLGNTQLVRFLSYVCNLKKKLIKLN